MSHDGVLANNMEGKDLWYQIHVSATVAVASWPIAFGVGVTNIVMASANPSGLTIDLHYRQGYVGAPLACTYKPGPDGSLHKVYHVIHPCLPNEDRVAYSFDLTFRSILTAAMGPAYCVDPAYCGGSRLLPSVLTAATDPDCSYWHTYATKREL
ncbi:MAG: hypothetical protein J3Q66DRAFT_372194 [Benniella sp.]|nr:MAG: hypothetical protein J3Q66DRAFT_372194 [Benniella sp.]